MVDDIIRTADWIFRVINFVGAGNALDLLGTSSQPDQPRMKERHVFGEVLRGIPLWIDCDEKRLNRFAGCPQTIDDEPDLLQVSGTDIGTIAISKIDQQPFAAKIRISPWSSRMITPREGAAGRAT